MSRAPSILFAVLVSFGPACGDDPPVVPDGSGDACGAPCEMTESGTTAVASGSGQVATSSTGPTTVDGTTVADGTTGEPAEPCSCRLSDDDIQEVGCSFDGIPLWTPGCPEATPCDRITVECMRPGQDLYRCMGQELLYDEAALQCALETLRDQVPARLEIDGREDMGIFSGQSRYVVHVRGDGTAVSGGCQTTDTPFFYQFGPSPRQVMDAAHFEGCLALPTATERYDCLWEGLPVAGGLPVCPG